MSKPPASTTSPSRDFDPRDHRRHAKDSDDQRTRGQKDRDRLLYSASLRRLAGVTQVASATEADIFHNRLTHTLKVAQVGRRIAEKLISIPDQKALAKTLGGIDPEVVEAAALAHDLGHPPFGHMGEKTLDKCLKEFGAEEGYEGNAQSFRIITKLAFCRDDFKGLNLTRATLNATLKYPWFWGREGKPNKKFGAYQTEGEDLRFARTGCAVLDRKSVEAEIMDWADDITYSVHDVEDFYQAGLIPLDRLASDDQEREAFYEKTKKRWTDTKNPGLERFDDHKEAFTDLAKLLPVTGPYTGSAAQREAIKPFISNLVRGFVFAISIRKPASENESFVEISEPSLLEVAMLKELTWNYVILRPALATQQHGQKKIIRSLFDVYSNALRDRDLNLIPPWFKVNETELGTNAEVGRACADIISTLTDGQAHRQYLRLNGISPGSIRDWI